MGKIRVDPDPAAGRFGRVAKLPDGPGLPVGGGEDEAGAPAGPRLERACDRRHRLDVALVGERAADAEDRRVLGFGRRPGSHVEPVGDRAHRRAGERKIVPEAREGVLADEGEAGERRNLKTRGGDAGGAPGRGLVGVAVEENASARGRGDQGGGGKMVLDHRDVDPAPAQEPGDAERLGDISAQRNVGDGRDLDPRERLVDRRTGDQGRARIAAVKDEIADAELDR